MPDHAEFSLAEYDETIRLVLSGGGEFTIFPKGTSMLPFIVQGRDSVTLEQPQGALHRGDIAFYQRENGQYVLHRVIAADGETYTMCGDNQLAPEYGVKPEQLIARAAYVTRNGKKIAPGNPAYRLYTLLWRSFFIRRAYFRLRRGFHGGK